MNWLTADLVRALSAPAVLLLVALGIAYAGFRDRNARIRETRELAREAVERAERETERWREAYTASEQARERQSEALREALELGRTATHVVEALRISLGQRQDGGQ